MVASRSAARVASLRSAWLRRFWVVARADIPGYPTHLRSRTNVFSGCRSRARTPIRGTRSNPGMATTEALVFDAIRTPRGKGKVNGSLHTTKPVDLVVGLMHETLSRNEHLDPKGVDDVVLG